jgi:hypothetical protein
MTIIYHGATPGGGGGGDGPAILQPHVDTGDDILAHWLFDGDLTDEKAAFDLNGTSSYAPLYAATTASPMCADLRGSTSGFSRASLGLLDTHGSFTFACALYLNALPTSGNWKPIVRSSPPAGGSGSANNGRIQVRIHDDGTVFYTHQYDNKISQSYTSTMTFPVGEWVYFAVTRNAAGTAILLRINDTEETETGLTGPNNGGSARFELFEEWDGDDFTGYAYSALFSDEEKTSGQLAAMKATVFPV